MTWSYGVQAGEGVGLPDQGVCADPGGACAQCLWRLLPSRAAHHHHRVRGRLCARLAQHHIPPGEHPQLWHGAIVGHRLCARLKQVGWLDLR